ncbi:MAG: glycosyltransferase family 9 protein [Candidatus Solibacter sp.]
MCTAGKPASRRVLVVRLGAMGDILHTLPAVAWLKQIRPQWELTWLVEPRWSPLLEGNPTVDRVMPLRRESLAGILDTRRQLRVMNFDTAVDFQGLLKSALPAAASGARERWGFDASQVRESLAARFYTHRICASAAHVVERNLELAAACSGVAHADGPRAFPLPEGTVSTGLPAGDFVLASPLAGWASKQWPMEHYGALAARLREELGVPLVLDGPPGADFTMVEAAMAHHSTLPELIYATRRATAVVGVDSGPLHLAAALGKPGVAIFGPTDPARNGPYGRSLRVLRTAGVATTYKRGAQIDESMRGISPDAVFGALRECLGRRPGSSA